MDSKSLQTGVQTEEEEPPNFDNQEYDEASLAEFLQRITPKGKPFLLNHNMSFTFYRLVVRSYCDDQKIRHKSKPCYCY